MLITFDGDPYDPVTRTLTTIPQEFMDESGWENNGLLHNESDDHPAYRMGFPGLIELEPTDQKTVSFGWYGHQPAAPTRWPKCFVEVPHQSHMNLDDNNGSFTFSYVINKASNETHFRDVEYELSGNTAYYSMDLARPLIRKGNVFYMWYQDNWAVSDRLYVQYPGGQIQWDIPAWFYGSNQVITFTWTITEPTTNNFVGVANLYVNGHIYATATHNYTFTFPSSTTTQPVEIAGRILSGGITFADRATTSTMMDQIFLLNKGLTPDEVARLYKKARPYDSSILFSQPNHYWPMSDEGTMAVTTMVDMKSGRNGNYRGTASQVVKEQAGPPRVAGALSTYFMNGGMATVHNTSSGLYLPFFNPSGDFTAEFWARIDNTTRSVLFSLQQDNLPYNGILVEANVRANATSTGQIQATIMQGSYLNNLVLRDDGQAYNFVDSQFHHFAVVRKATVVQLWIDAVLHSQTNIAVAAIPSPGPGQLYLMGMMPGNLNTTGYMSGVALYAYALDPHEIRMRNLYSLLYKIKGTVTLQGNPHQATIRAIDHRTGELSQEVLSDSGTGDYQITLYDNSLIDLMALNKQDRNIRYRVYGPITPTPYEDLA